MHSSHSLVHVLFYSLCSLHYSIFRLTGCPPLPLYSIVQQRASRCSQFSEHREGIHERAAPERAWQRGVGQLSLSALRPFSDHWLHVTAIYTFLKFHLSGHMPYLHTTRRQIGVMREHALLTGPSSRHAPWSWRQPHGQVKAHAQCGG